MVVSKLSYPPCNAYAISCGTTLYHTDPALDNKVVQKFTSDESTISALNS